MKIPLADIRCNSTARICCVLCTFWLLTACGNHTYHIVKPGETLYAIGWWYGVDYRTLARLNGIAPPYTLAPGNKILLTRATAHKPILAAGGKSTDGKIPETDHAVILPASDARRPQSEKVNVVVRPLAGVQNVPIADSADVHNTAQTIHWQWPVRGHLLQRFKNSDQYNKGIKVAGVDGQEIYAAAPGKIVYAGNALLGYGNLVIVKHNAEFLSAYGHVRKLLVREGDYIRAGQQIAEMGSSGTNRIMLHFEIRRSGQPVDPLQFLPVDNMIN